MDNIQIGNLVGKPISENESLVGETVLAYLKENKGLLENLDVVEIDPNFSDTVAFCDYYKVTPAEAANCVIVKGIKDGSPVYTACVILATTKTENQAVKGEMGVKNSFAPMEEAVSLTEMEYGGISPIGLPNSWPILIDERVANTELVIIGSGIRKSKILINGPALAQLKNSKVIKDLARPRE